MVKVMEEGRYTAPDSAAGERTVHDPFLGRDVQVSNRLVDRLRGRYANGPTLPNGEPEFGWRQFDTAPIQHEAAAHIEACHQRIDELEKAMEPFAKLAEFVSDGHRDARPIVHGFAVSVLEQLTIGHLRAAKAALAQTQVGDNLTGASASEPGDCPPKSNEVKP